MIMTALNEKSQIISVDEFFAKHIEFSYNQKMVDQTTRNLKMLLRHPYAVEELSNKIGENYAFTVFGEKRTYTVVFTITTQSIVLIDIW